MVALLPISSSSSPFATAPSSPRIREASSKVPAADDFPHAVYFSAPTTPAHNSSASSSASFVPFSWEQEETRKDDFEFEFSAQLDFARQSASAEELFGSGSWIRPLKPPPRILNDGAVFAPSNISPRGHPDFSCGILSTGFRISSPANFDFNPVKAEAMEIGRLGEEEEEAEEQEVPLMQRYNRGRDLSDGSVSRREMRSLPPIRVSDVIFDNSTEDVGMEGRDRDNKSETRTTPYLTRLTWLFGNTPGYGYRRWRLRDLLLFRSVSEGTGTRNLRSKEDTVTRRDYEMGSSSNGSGQRRWTEGDSFRLKDDSVGLTSLKKKSVRQTQSNVSRNNSVELHYTMNRAMSEEMKRKTFLPYRRGVLGCLGFGDGGGSVGRDLVHGVGSLTRGQ